MPYVYNYAYGGVYIQVIKYIVFVSIPASSGEEYIITSPGATALS